LFLHAPLLVDCEASKQSKHGCEALILSFFLHTHTFFFLRFVHPAMKKNLIPFSRCLSCASRGGRVKRAGLLAMLAYIFGMVAVLLPVGGAGSGGM
jgi:hypothetical protein